MTLATVFEHMAEEHEDFVPLWLQQVDWAKRGRERGAEPLDLADMIRQDMISAYQRRRVVQEYLSKDDTSLYSVEIVIEKQTSPATLNLPPTIYDESPHARVFQVPLVCFRVSLFLGL